MSIKVSGMSVEDVQNFNAQMAEINWDSEEQQKPTLLPQGVYTVFIDGADIQKKDKEGKPLEFPRILWRFRVTENEEFDGTTVWDICFTTPKSLWRLKGLFKAIKFKPEPEDFLGSLDDTLGKTLLILVTHKEYNGETHNQVSKFETADKKSLTVNGDKVPF